MKVEQRHETNQNQLADWMADKYVDIKPYVTTIVVSIVAIIAIWLGYKWFANRAETATAETWNDYYKSLESTGISGDEDQIRKFIKEHSGDPAAMVARQRLALRLMSQAAAMQLTNREKSISTYAAAIDLFEQVRDETKEESLQRFASYQIAIANESRYDLDKALAAYKTIADKWPDSMEGQRAKLRIEDLNRPATKEFYAWHKTATPATTPAPTAPITPVEPSTDLDKLPPTDPMPPANPVPPAETTTPPTETTTPPATETPKAPE